jgi:dethiobiotin synthetase
MNAKPTRGLFIAGTGTGVGKTYVACLIAQSLTAAGCRVGVYKPVASGCRLVDGVLVSDDALALWNAAGRPETLSAVCPQSFAAPLAPHLAAHAAAKTVDPELLIAGAKFWQGRCDVLLVEGAGGLMSPASDELYMADVALELGFPLIVVSANVLGTINATLQTLITASTFRDGLEVAGVVLCDVAASASDPSAASNLQELAARCVPPVLAHVAWQESRFNRHVDWRGLAGNAD